MPVVRPLLRLGLASVIEMHRKYGLPLNPLYKAGATRVGCFPCINSVKSEMRLVPEVAPQQIAKISAQEAAFNAIGRPGTFFHRNTVPLRFRSQWITTTKGVRMLVATIADVVRWARWKNKKELRAEAAEATQPLFTEDKHLGCTSSMGSCE